MKMNLFKILIIISATASCAIFFSSCQDDDPKKEDTPEMITKVMLSFTPVDDGDVITGTATQGALGVVVDGPIKLAVDKSYMLDIQLINELIDPTDEGYDVSAEVKAEGDEHMFFFSWTNNVFADPLGNGNIDNRADAVNYEDMDKEGLPLGIETSWTTGETSSGKFRVVLKHQPGLKTETSDATMGETDLDLEFDVITEP